MPAYLLVKSVACILGLARFYHSWCCIVFRSTFLCMSGRIRGYLDHLSPCGDLKSDKYSEHVQAQQLDSCKCILLCLHSSIIHLQTAVRTPMYVSLVDLIILLSHRTLIMFEQWIHSPNKVPQHQKFFQVHANISFDG